MDDDYQLQTLTFTNGTKSKTRYKLELGENEISIIGEGEEEKKIKRFRYDDIIGVKLDVECSKVSSKQVATTTLIHSITICAYPTTKVMFSSKQSRKRVGLTLCLNHFDTPEKNKEALVMLKESINQRLLPQTLTTGNEPRFNKPLLILLNPTSGKGLAKKLFKDKISPMLKEANVEFTMIETERSGHGKELAMNTDLSKYYGIVIVSGDGLLYEVYQGLMSRSDAAEAIKVPVGILPAGSGNALCCSINYSAGEPVLYELLLHSAFLLLKHTVRPMDIVAIDTPGGKIYSFLSVTWGMIADIDIESERFRNLGNARFAVEAISKIISPKTYKGRLSFLPNSPYVSKGRSKTDVDIIVEQPTENPGDRVRSVSMPSTHDVADLTENSTNTAQSNGDAHHTPAVDEVVEEAVVELPPLDLPLPSRGGWVTIEDNFVSIIASYQSHLGPDMMASPAATMLDGLIYLLIIRAPVTRMQMLAMMGQFETGAQVRNPLVELVAVKAFRLEPQAQAGNLVVDGEVVPYGPIQGKVVPGLARVMVK